MPIYEYECSECNHRMEVIQKISDTPLRDCPACNKPSLRKLVSAASFRLKGTGWYETDFKDKGKPKPATEENKGKPTDNKGTEGKNKDTKASESKPKDTKKSGEA
uniref:Putative regulatory protein, FmdB family n=1 Tax=Candidatus Kentrum sp. FW TaxID=2126338 RepID=A0A450T380_9GAMM|nr:MAG: putative regulatory protein, FmdB family [Candidatus Kentron sp. FW]VFJ62492.1 MAG: putative regulatory protein, FmdB family [Candidatus Kentron sp. FW]